VSSVLSTVNTATKLLSLSLHKLSQTLFFFKINQ
jgi:hypothetical protein